MAHDRGGPLGDLSEAAGGGRLPADAGAATGGPGAAMLVCLAAQLGGMVVAGDEQVQVQQNLSGGDVGRFWLKTC